MSPLARPRPELRQSARNALCSQAHRLEHRALEIGIEGLTLRPLEHVAEHRDAGVGVLGVRARWIDERGPIEARDGGRERRLGVVEVVADRRLAREAGRGAR